MSGYAISSITSTKGEVIVQVRAWDGIDHPDYMVLDGLSPGQAQGWATQLEIEAEKSALWLKNNDVALRKRLIKERDALADQITLLDKKIAAKTDVEA